MKILLIQLINSLALINFILCILNQFLYSFGKKIYKFSHSTTTNQFIFVNVKECNIKKHEFKKC